MQRLEDLRVPVLLPCPRMRLARAFSSEPLALSAHNAAAAEGPPHSRPSPAPAPPVACSPHTLALKAMPAPGGGPTAARGTRAGRPGVLLLSVLLLALASVRVAAAAAAGGRGQSTSSRRLLQQQPARPLRQLTQLPCVCNDTEAAKVSAIARMCLAGGGSARQAIRCYLLALGAAAATAAAAAAAPCTRAASPACKHCTPHSSCRLPAATCRRASRTRLCAPPFSTVRCGVEGSGGGTLAAADGAPTSCWRPAFLPPSPASFTTLPLPPCLHAALQRDGFIPINCCPALPINNTKLWQQWAGCLW